MLLSYKYRIYPTKLQEDIIKSDFNFCRFLYNSALEERKSYYKKYGKSLSVYSQLKYLPEIKKEFQSQTENLYSQSIQYVLKQLDDSYKNFFRRVKNKSKKVGFPRFKSNDRFNSICFPQSDLNGFGVRKIDESHVNIYGLGLVKAKFHRDYEGVCKKVILKKHSDKYYIIAVCDKVNLKPLPETGKTVGIDLGLTNFIATSDGLTFKHPKPYKTAKEKLAYLNKKLALKKRGSNNRKKAKRSLARAYERVSNIRDDFQHKMANLLVKSYDVIAMEDLNIKSMMESESKEVNKSNISDASMSSFMFKVAYKAERAGKQLIKVNPRNTSKTCSSCGKLKDNLTLHDRVYNCEHCGLKMDRDKNAAVNILRLGISLVGSYGRSPAL